MSDQVLKAMVVCRQRWIEWTEPRPRDEGSVSTETAIIVGLVGTAALVLAGLVVAAIRKYSAEIP